MASNWFLSIGWWNMFLWLKSTMWQVHFGDWEFQIRTTTKQPNCTSSSMYSFGLEVSWRLPQTGKREGYKWGSSNWPHPSLQSAVAPLSSVGRNWTALKRNAGKASWNWKGKCCSWQIGGSLFVNSEPKIMVAIHITWFKSIIPIWKLPPRYQDFESMKLPRLENSSWKELNVIEISSKNL